MPVGAGLWDSTLIWSFRTRSSDCLTVAEPRLHVNFVGSYIVKTDLRMVRFWEAKLEELSDYRAEPPVGIDPIGASTEATALLYKVIREDIVSGRLKANQRLVAADLAKRHGSSTTPVREVLQLLRGEGFVVFTRNRGARVRPIDRDFIRDIYEIGVLIEPALTRWFVGMATEADIAELEWVQSQIEVNNFADQIKHSDLDTKFHTLIYQRHYNRHAAELWWKHREVLRAVSRQFNFTLVRRAQIISDHRELIAHIKAGDADQAAELVARHVEGSGLHILEHMRAMAAARAG
jgi:DNA-binding GntR family transcriptional regulator